MSESDGRTPETAWPLRVLSGHVRDWIARLGRAWIEGQIVEINRRSGDLTWLTVRDPQADISATVIIDSRIVAAVRPPLNAGARVLLFVQVEFWPRGGKLVLRAAQIRPVGVGALLAMLEQRKNALAAEGLFAAIRKRPLPLLPRKIGLITGSNTKAKHDVVGNATRRWPAARFEVREGVVQGDQAVATMLRYLRELDADPDVDVIIFARGGGSLEDLLPFSDESLIRAVSRARTSVVSAIGHEQDSPLLDLVADLRASTPTDAGKAVVPDLAGEHRAVADARARLDRLMITRLRSADEWLAQVRRRPVLLDAGAWLPRQYREVAASRARVNSLLTARLSVAERELQRTRAHARALSPVATLERGYAVVLGPAGHLVRDAAALRPGDQIAVRLASGGISAEVTGVE